MLRSIHRPSDSDDLSVTQPSLSASSLSSNDSCCAAIMGIPNILENPQDPGSPSCIAAKNVIVQRPLCKNAQWQYPSHAAGGVLSGIIVYCDDNYEGNGYYPLKRRKPSRTLLFLRNRANASNISISLLTLALACLTGHRLFSLYMTHRRWINAPITYIPRTCPAVEYETITAAQQRKENQDEQTTVAEGTSSLAASTSTSINQKRHTENQRKLKMCMTTLTDVKSTSILQRFFRWRNFDKILDLTWENKVRYAKKHGYYLFDESKLIDTSRPPAWSKILAVRRLLVEEACDWVMWTDADTVIMNSNIQMEDFLPSDDSKDLLVVSDNGGGYNSGVFVVRNTEWARQWLDQWWNMKSFVRPPGFSLSGDNNAMKALLREMKDFDDHVLSPARCTFNSFGVFLTLHESMPVMDALDQQEWYMSEDYYHKGDFIAHIPGYDNKSECLRLLLQEAL